MQGILFLRLSIWKQKRKYVSEIDIYSFIPAHDENAYFIYFTIHLKKIGYAMKKKHLGI